MLPAIQHSMPLEETTKTQFLVSKETPIDSPLSFDALSNRLNLWMHQGAPQEKRQEAKNRILAAYQTHAPELRLNTLALREIPPEIGGLQHLQSLCLWGNQLTTLPVEMWSLSGLKKLNIGRNALETLPADIKNLIHLEELNIRGNPIRDAPIVFQELPNLKIFHTNHSNPAILRFRSNPNRLSRCFSAIENDLVLPNLPPNLASIQACLQFFNAFSQQLNGHYFALQALTSSSLLEPVPTWTQTISSVLQIFSTLSSVLTGEVLNSLSQQRARKEACEQAFFVLNLFPTPLHFMATVRHAGVLFTERLAKHLQKTVASDHRSTSEPQVNNYTKKLRRAYSTLQIKTGFQIEQPWEKVPSAKAMSTQFLKNLIKNKNVHQFAINNNLALPRYARHLAEVIVRDVLEQNETYPNSVSPFRRLHQDLGAPQTESSSATEIHELHQENDFDRALQEAIAKALKPIKEEMEQLRLEVRQLKQENEALRDASVILAKPH